ncbi:MAG: hypothetical protein R2816_01265 [Flavobacteriaceae bacterium]|nr:hypothetical protein [Flavobacteriaceae bacterium]
MNKEINTPQNNSEEVDLGQLFKMIGNLFDRLFSFLGNIFNKLFLAFVWCAFFVKKNIIILFIAAVLGFAYGFFEERKSAPVFESSVLIRQNYSTGENLYNTINYYNGLLSQKDYTALANELSIDTSYVSSIINFEVEALISENQRLIEFNKYIKRLDSALVSTIDYKDYMENVKEYIYEMQQLTVKSKTNENFDKVFDAIVKSLNSNTFFKREQEKDIRQLENRKLAIERALAESDSLQKVYKKVLEKSLETQKGSQTSITIEGSDDKNKTKEFDLYKNDIELRRELVNIERDKENKQFIIEILSNIPNRGFVDTSIQFLGKSFSPKVFFSAFFAFVVFTALLMLRFVKFLEKYKNKV